MNAAETIRSIEKSAVSDVVRDATALAIGDIIQQGDVYVQRTENRAIAHGKERGSRQVAVGTTVGARHFAEGAVKVYNVDVAAVAKALKIRPEMVGPLVVADGVWCLSHPEHASFRMPAGEYLVTYQLDLATQRAVQD